MFKHVRRILIAAVPVTFTVLAFTASGASAQPKNSCADYASIISGEYDSYQFAAAELSQDTMAEAPQSVIDADNQHLLLANDRYSEAVTNAARAGCF